MLSFFPRDVLDEILNLIESVSEGFPSYSCSKELKHKLEPAMINEPSVFEPLKFYCMNNNQFSISQICRKLKIPSYIYLQKFSEHIYIFLLHFNSNYYYQKVNFLGPENLLEISVVPAVISK